MRKRIFSIVLVLALFCGLFALGSASAEEEDAPEYTEITGAYADGTTGFVYSDDFFLQSSSQLSGDICKIAVALSGAAYDESQIRSMLGNEQMGFTVNTYDYGDRTLDDNDRVAFAIAGKDLPGGKKLYFVVIRGTVGLEWFSNFNMQGEDLNGGEHTGFQTAAEKVMSQVSSVILNDGASASDRYVLFTGHSRGAAVANIIAAHYTSVSHLAPADHIFGYTFACPAVNKTVVAYPNIYNFNNTGDAIPTVPLKDWGFKRFGVDVPCAFTASPEFMMSYSAQFNGENASTPDTLSYELAVKTLFPEETTVNEPLGHFAAMLLAWALSQTTEVSFSDLLVRYGKDVVTDEFLFQQLLNVTGLGGAYRLVLTDKDNFLVDKQFLLDAIEYWSSQEEYTQEKFNVWAAPYRDRIDSIYEETGYLIRSVADLSPSLNALIDLIPIAVNVGIIIACIMDITENSVGGAMDAIVDGHKSGTYVVGLNAMYYGYSAFRSVSNLAAQSVPANVRTIGHLCFYGSGLPSISGMEHIEYIGTRAFYKCTQLTGIKLGAVKKLSSEMFFGCTALKDLTLDGVEAIDTSAFRNCTGLEELYIPDSVKELGISNSFAPFEGCTGLRNISVGGVEILKEHMLRTGSKNLESLTIRGSVKEIAEQAFFSHSAIDQQYNYTAEHPVSLVLEEGVEKIGRSAFSGCTVFTSLSLPSTLTSIEDSAFYGCSGLTELELKYPVEFMGSHVFWRCDGLTNLVLTQSVSTSQFSDCTKLESVICRGATTIATDAFSGCTALNTVDLEGVEKIAFCAFENCTALEELYIPDSVKTLEVNSGRGPFHGCTGLKEISVGGVEKLGVYMLRTGSHALEKLTIRGTVKEVKERALYSNGINYDNGYNFTSDHAVELVLEEGVETIGNSAFDNCTAFTSVTLPSTVTTIGNSAFYGCTGLNYALFLGAEEGWSAVAVGSGNDALLSRLLWYREPDFTLPAALSTVEDEAFCGIAAVSVRLPETVTGIGERAFADCPALRQIIIPAGVTDIDEDAFAGVERLLIVGVPGSAAEQFAAARGYAFLSR